MKKVIIFLIVGLFVFLGAQVRLEQGKESQWKQSTFANSRVDTVRFPRLANLTGLTFAADWGDSVTCTMAILRRLVNGSWLAVQAGDTLTDLSNQATAAVLKVNNVTLTPYCDEYAVIVTYADSANGVTSPTVTYKAIQQLY